MGFNAHDVHVCAWKIVKLLSKTCVTFSLKYPYISFSLLCLFLLYMSFPLVFWVLIYSVPLVVCTSIILNLSFNLGNVKRHKEEGEEENDDGKHSRKTRFVADDDSENDKDKKKTFGRVHSVRRRRANKDFRREEDNKVEDKNAVSSTNFNCDMVDKNAVTEESPKDIREVRVDKYSAQVIKTSSSPSASSHQSSIKREFLLDGINNEDDDHQKNEMDNVGIPDIESNKKRLESLIARRRSRKLLSVEVRRTLMNLDRNMGQIGSIVIPKNNNINTISRFNVPSNVGGGPVSPSPGSAPSVLIPMRNPFDLPYDPQEEKPDLTGDDTFQQEFMSANNRDMLFCRHESFSLGPFLPGEFNQTGFRHRAEYQFSKTGKEFDREFAPIMEHESYQVSESKSTIIDSPDGDHIKEIIQVYDQNGTDRSHSEEEEEEDDFDEVETRPTPEEDDSSSSPSSSSDDDAPVFKIDREAILKSLSSMARRNAVEEERDKNNDEQIGGEHLSSATTTTAYNENRLKDRFCYPDHKPIRHHSTSYSIASDLQVEVSEVSSPPLTIDENYSYIDDDDDDENEDVSTCDEGDMMEKKITWDGEDSWAAASTSHLDLSQVDENESRSSTQVNEISEQDVIKVGFSRIKPHEEDNTTLFWSSSRTRATNLDEKIHQTFQPSNGNDSDKPLESCHACDETKNELNAFDDLNDSNIHTYQIEEPKTGEGQFEKLDECRDTEHLTAAEGIMSSEEDSIEKSEHEHEEMVNAAIIIEDQTIFESIQHSEGEQISGDASVTRETMRSNNVDEAASLMPSVDAFGVVQTCCLSPISVLQPSFSVDQLGSLTSFDHDVDEEVRQFGAQVSTPIAHQESTALVAPPHFDGDDQVSKESSEPSTMSTTESNDAESLKQHKIDLQNGVIKPEEIASSSSQTPSSHEAQTEETSSTSFNNDDQNFPTACTQITHHSNTSISPISHTQELSKNQEMVFAEAAVDDSNKSSSYEDHTENSETNWNCFDEVETGETSIDLSGPVEDNVNSEKDTHTNKQHEDKLEIVDAFNGESK